MRQFFALTFLLCGFSSAAMAAAEPDAVVCALTGTPYTVQVTFKNTGLPDGMAVVALSKSSVLVLRFTAREFLVDPDTTGLMSLGAAPHKEVFLNSATKQAKLLHFNMPTIEGKTHPFHCTY